MIILLTSINCLTKTIRICCICTLLLWCGCANQGSLSGGDQDKTPPQVLKTNPVSGSINYQGLTLEIQFDEYFKLDNVQGQVIISPTIDPVPSFKVRKKSLILEFSDSLERNTTYVINFGESIKDNNEGNTLNNYSFVFSTGNYVDSMRIEGKVTHANDLKPADDISIMLYDNFADSVPFKEKPYYFTRTNKDGSYVLNNLRAGSYKVFAIDDKNRNYLYDDPGVEAIAFLDSNINLPPDSLLQLFVFKEEIFTKQEIKKVVANKRGKILIVFAKAADKFTISPLNVSFKKAWYIEEFNKNKDSLQLWTTNLTVDTLKAVVRCSNDFVDTITVIIPTGETHGRTNTRATSQKEEFLQLKSNIPANKVIGMNDSLILTIGHPLKDHLFGKMKLIEDSVVITNLNVIMPPDNHRKIIIPYRWKPKSRYQITIPSASLTDIYDLKNDSTAIKFSTNSIEDYGIVNLDVKLPKVEHQFILQLCTENDRVIKQLSASGDIRKVYNFLEPKTYKLKLIYDKNGNGKWDSGNYLQHIQPEKVVYHPEIFNIRANWEVDIDWNLGE